MAAFGCAADQGVTLRLPPDEPLPERAEFLVLPYDPRAILDSLFATTTTSPPGFPALSGELSEYEQPDPTAAADIHTRWDQARGRVQALADTLYRLERDTPEYAATYRRFRARYAELTGREAELERALQELTSEELVERAVRAADSLRRWEEQVLEPFDSIVTARRASTGRSEYLVEFDAEGSARLDLEPGHWWLVGRGPSAESPFFEHAWHAEFVVNPLVPVTVPIGPHHVTLRWRH